MFTHNYTLFLLLLQTPPAPQSRHPTCVVIHGGIDQDRELQPDTTIENCYRQNRSTERCSKFKVRRHDKFRNKWSQHKNKCKSQLGQNQVSGGVAVG